MRRRRVQLGMADGDHRQQAIVGVSAAQLDLQRFKQVKTCSEKLKHLRNAAASLAHAEAHQQSVEKKDRTDVARQRELRFWSASYQRAWEYVRRRCVRK